MSKERTKGIFFHKANSIASEIITKYKLGLISHSEAEANLRFLYSGLLTEAQNWFDMDQSVHIEWSNNERTNFADELLEFFSLRKNGSELVFDESIQLKFFHYEPIKKRRLPDDFLESKSMLEETKDNATDKSTEEEVSHYLAKFEKYHLSDIGTSDLRGFFRYLLQQKITGIPYHFLIQADSYGQAYDFTLELKNTIERIQRKELHVESFSESDLLDKPALDRWQASDVIVVSPCISNDDYYPSDDDSSNVRSSKKAYDDHWSKVMAFYDKHPEKVFIICGTPQIVQERIKNNARMYYRFFKHRIFLGSMTETEVYEATLRKVKNRIGLYTVDFPDKLREYINTVYPKADLRDMDFVKDLYEWMVALSFEKSGNCNSFSENSIPYYHKSASLESINNEFRHLVGLDSIKETFMDIGRMCQNMPKSQNEQPYLHMAFRGNPGTGKTTVARFIAKLLSSMRVIKRNHVEEVMTSDLLGEYTGQTGPKVERIINKAAGGVLVIDEAYLLNPDTGAFKSTYREECVGTLMKAMERRCDPVIIFAGYPKEMDAFLKSNPGLSSRIGYNIVFDDYTNEQLVSIFKIMCNNAGYEYDSRTLNAVERKLVALRYEDHFGNARAVENIFGQAVSECLREDVKSRFITENHIKIGKNAKTLDELLDDLNGLVGIENAKRIIKEQILSCRFSKEQEKVRPVSNNMVFVGNAGTGKTTTAKLFSEMLFSIGVSKSPRAKMITAKDLYVQNVASKLNDLCNEAMGGVLFIDEIYLLQSHAYVCTEVISVLLEILEDKKEDITVILAGYEKQMADFLEENQGLKSRFPITVFFNDFTEDELCQIFVQECENAEICVSDEAMDRFKSIIKMEMKKVNFGNGRAVRNLYEQAYRRHAVNFYEYPDRDPDLLMPDDIEEPSTVSSHKPSIGFVH